MSQPVQLTVAQEESGMRLDSYLVKHFSKHSRVKLQRAIAAGGVKLDGGSAKSSTKLKTGQAVLFVPPERVGCCQLARTRRRGNEMAPADCLFYCT